MPAKVETLSGERAQPTMATIFLYSLSNFFYEVLILPFAISRFLFLLAVSAPLFVTLFCHRNYLYVQSLILTHGGKQVAKCAG